MRIEFSHGRRSRVSWQVNDQRIAKVHSYSKEKVKSVRVHHYAPPASGTAAAVRCDHGLVPAQAFQRWWPSQCGAGGVATTRSRPMRRMGFDLVTSSVSVQGQPELGGPGLAMVDGDGEPGGLVV
jgi:hypothetical protein